MTVRFVHAADLHLGSPLHALEDSSGELATTLARATETAFERVVTVAIDRDVDFIVVAGDLYDREARSVRANQFLVEQFDRLRASEIPAYVVHGNHDPLGRGAEKLDFPDNVYVFGTEGVESATYPDEADPEAEILGRSYATRHESTNFVEAYTPGDTAVPTIGLLHTALDPGGLEYVPCSIEDLAAQELDYWALGHVHHPRTIGGAPGAYPGIPQPRHIGEPAVGGCLIVELDAGEPPEIAFVPTASVAWQSVEIDVEELDSGGERRVANLTDLEGHLVDEGLDVQNRSLEELVAHDFSVEEADWEPTGFICRWSLRGRGEVHEVLADADGEVSVIEEHVRDRLREDDPFVWTEAIRDRTEPPLPDRETLVEENDVIAEFVDLVDDFRADPDEREAIREVTGGAWEVVEDPDRETTRHDRVPMTDDRLDELIDEAAEIAITRLAANRYDVD